MCVTRSCSRGVAIGAFACALLLLVQAARAQDQPAPPEAPAPPPNAEGDGSATFQTFYDSLGSVGTWIQTSDYGYVWQPTISDPNWAPYTDGHWVYTDDGWTWDSDEPWGWATYHYGRWVNLAEIGWCWVPGYVWAPAWVSWRYGDGYCGWAPLPPDSLVGVDYDSNDEDDGGFHIGGDCDSYYGIGAGWYNFVPVGSLGERNYRGYYINRNNNYRLINHTTNVTNLNVTRGGAGAAPGRGNFAGVSLGGPSLLQVNAVSQSPIQRVNLAYAPQAGGGALTDRSLALFAPRVGAGDPSAVRPLNTARSVGHAEINRGTDISRPLLISSHLATPAPTASQVQQAHLAQGHAPLNAHVATPDMPVRSSFSTPLSGMRPAYAPSSPGRTYPGGQGYRPASRSYASPAPAPYAAPRAYPSPGGSPAPAGGGGGGGYPRGGYNGGGYNGGGGRH